VTVGEKPRLGIAGLDQDDDIVQGIVLMPPRRAELANHRRVEALVASINNSSNPAAGRAHRTYYDRKDLIDITTATVPAQHGGRHSPDRAAAMDFLGSAQAR